MDCVMLICFGVNIRRKKIYKHKLTKASDNRSTPVSSFKDYSRLFTDGVACALKTVRVTRRSFHTQEKINFLKQFKNWIYMLI